MAKRSVGRPRAPRAAQAATGTTSAAVEPMMTADVADSLRERFKWFPALDLIERRLNDPHDPGTLPILLKDEPASCCGDIGHAFKAKPGATMCKACGLPFRTWYVRWTNLGEQNRWSQLRSRGYVKVTVGELRDRDEIPGMNDKANEDSVTRGDRNQEVLVKMPWPYFIEIRRERERQARRAQTPAAIKKAVMDGAGSDEIADDIDQSLTAVTSTRHASSLGDELGDGSDRVE